MTSKIVTRMEFTAAPFASIRHAVVDLAMGVWRPIVAIKHRRELAHLADLDDRMLAGVQKLPDIRRIFLTRRPLPSAPILAIPAAHATTKHLTSNHHDNDGSTPTFHRTAGQRLPVSVRRTPPWELSHCRG
jgi:hypothetical protein